MIFMLLYFFSKTDSVIIETTLDNTGIYPLHNSLKKVFNYSSGCLATIRSLKLDSK